MKTIAFDEYTIEWTNMKDKERQTDSVLIDSGIKSADLIIAQLKLELSTDNSIPTGDIHLRSIKKVKK